MKELKFVLAKTDSRSCFGIYFFKTIQEAEGYHKLVVARGDTVNGGYFHGMQCGRAKEFDHKDAVLGQLYAVRVA